MRVVMAPHLDYFTEQQRGQTISLILLIFAAVTRPVRVAFQGDAEWSPPWDVSECARTRSPVAARM